MHPTNRLLAASLLIMTAACRSNTDLSQKDLVRYYARDNEAVTKIIKTAACDYKFQILTPEYVALRDSKQDQGGLDTAVFTHRLQELASKTYLTIRLTNKASNRSIIQAGTGSEADIADRTQYYQFDASKQLFCLCGTDTLRPLDYAFEDGYNLVNHATISAVFDSCHKSSFTAVFNDQPAGHSYLQAGFDQSRFPRLK